MARLRSDEGCPWDREQTMQSLRPYLLEEAYETLEAIDRGDPAKHCEELGDVLLQIVFQSQLAAEQNRFDVADVVDGICHKLLRRHPHVFGSEKARTADDVIEHWERIKKEEKSDNGDEEAPAVSILDGVPRSLPALLAAHRMSERAARVGFDWRNPAQVLAKVREELLELEQALDRSALSEQDRELAWEIGDLLFALANLARHLGLDAEDVLREANARFRKRFALVEQFAGQRSIDLMDATIEELEDLWQEAKQTLKPAG